MYSSDYCIPDSNSWMFCRTPGMNGAVPGGPANGYSNYVYYGDFDLQGTWAENGIRKDLAEFFNVSGYKKTEFMLWMKTNLPAVEKTLPGNYPHYNGLKRKRS